MIILERHFSIFFKENFNLIKITNIFSQIFFIWQKCFILFCKKLFLLISYHFLLKLFLYTHLSIFFPRNFWNLDEQKIEIHLKLFFKYNDSLFSNDLENVSTILYLLFNKIKNNFIMFYNYNKKNNKVYDWENHILNKHMKKNILP